MTEIQRILDQMDRAFSGDAWHGPSLMSLLEGIAAEDASRRTIPGAQSIWELVHHIGAWQDIVHRRLNGENVEITTERDWPHVWEVSDSDWKQALDNLKAHRSRLRDFVAGLSDDQLDQKAAGSTESRYVVLHGVVQHDLYHAGQIAIMKKTLG
jgi:uncharacterized damage-inducible protein DinB